MPRTEKQSSTSAKVLYRPVGLVSSVIAGVVAGQVFKQVWRHATRSRVPSSPSSRLS
jgi:hypothetical protein